MSAKVSTPGKTIEPAEPQQPTRMPQMPQPQPAKAEKPVKSAKSARPHEPEQPAKPVTPVDAVKPREPNKPADAGPSAEPLKPLKPLRPVTPTNTEDHGGVSSGIAPCRAPEAAETPPRPFYLGRGNLRRRGWTETGISRFLGAADALAPNPVVPSAAHMRLYDEARVARVEATDAWREWHAASQQRRESNRLRAEERARERADRLARLGMYAEATGRAANSRAAPAHGT